MLGALPAINNNPNEGALFVLWPSASAVYVVRTPHTTLFIFFRLKPHSINLTDALSLFSFVGV